MKRTRYLQSLQPKSSELSKRPCGENSKQISSSSEKTSLKNSETRKKNYSIPTRKRFFLRRNMLFDDLLMNFGTCIIFDGILEFRNIQKNLFYPNIFFEKKSILQSGNCQKKYSRFINYSIDCESKLFHRNSSSVPVKSEKMSSNREIWNPMTGSGRSGNQENSSMQKPGLVKYSENIAVSPSFVILVAHHCNKKFENVNNL